MDPINNFYGLNNQNNIQYNKKNKSNLLILNYNIHGWVNLNKNINNSDNFLNIFNLIKNIPDLDLIIFEEVCFNNITPEYISNTYKSLGYIDFYYVPNGGCFRNPTKTDYIFIMAKFQFQNKNLLDITKSRFTRFGLYFEYNKKKIIVTHLEIGKRYHHIKNGIYKNKTISENILDRKSQLDLLLDKFADPDIIIGDFNFSPQEPEFDYLISKGFNFTGDKNINTTPYNRVDLIFLNNNINLVSEKIINSNYSDHLPVLFEINWDF